MTEHNGEELVINRVFDAPRAEVYRAFTDPDQLAQWFGPVGFSVPRDSVEIDARPGGVQRFVMVSDTDPSMTSPVTARFSEVIENELLVGVADTGDEPASERPLTLRVEFHDEDGGKTRILLRQGPFAAVQGSVPTDMLQNGWLSSFTKLDTLLAA
jgi:uncharacterized protein YndB with AHSA1/START domain